mmetsp:Transcript_12329/g.23560  ORF Transcript_12329/g.23560 Transcript_12329/m.23560 type:complete len:92 (-) Transcript_12329:673-948(-)
MSDPSELQYFRFLPLPPRPELPPVVFPFACLFTTSLFDDERAATVAAIEAAPLPRPPLRDSTLILGLGPVTVWTSRAFCRRPAGDAWLCFF